MSHRLAFTVLIAAAGLALSPRAWVAEDDEATPAAFLTPDQQAPAPAEAAAPAKSAQKQPAAKAPEAQPAAPAAAQKLETETHAPAAKQAEAPVTQPVAPAAAQKTEPEAATPAAKQDQTPAAQPVAADAVKKEEAAPKAEAKRPPLPEAEQKVHALIKDAFAGAKARGYMKGRVAQEVFPAQAVLMALERNLSIETTRKGEEIAAAAKMEARAVFDPFITVSYTHTNKSTNTRMEKVHTFQRRTVNDIRDGANVLDMAGQAIPKFPQKRIVFSNPRPQGYFIKRNIASLELPNGPEEVDNYNFRVDQQMPWGPSAFLLLASRRQETLYDDGPDAEIDQRIQNLNTIIADPNVSDAEKEAVRLQQQELIRLFKRTVFKFSSYNRPWTSSFTLGGFVPVPLTKDWGKYARADVSITLAGLDQERAFYDTKTVIDITLRNVDHLYWDLVAAMENLRAAVENRTILEALQQSTQKALDAGRVTIYAKHQIDTQLAGVKELEEQAWSAYLQTSNALANQLDADDNVVLLPAGYSENLAKQMVPNFSDAYAVALENRPDLKAQQVGGRVSEILLRHQINQRRPDLKYTPTLKFAQNTKPLGYKSVGASLGALFLGDGSEGRFPVNVPNKGISRPAAESQIHQLFLENKNGPDLRQHSHTLSYAWPYKNRAAKAAVEEVTADRDRADINIEISVRTVEQNVGDAIADILSAREQSRLAMEQYNLAKQQYDEAGKLMDAGKMTEFEILSRTSDLLNADLNRIASSAAYKKAESQLLQAEGILANTYNQARSESEVDDVRLEALAQGGALRFFKPVTVQPDAQPAAAEKAPGEPQASNVSHQTNLE
jgi:outer membrane protein TolC